jgi:predicted aminopeptidase
MRERKLRELGSLGEKLKAYPRLKDVAPNNALLAAHATYTALVPAFEKLLAEEGGDLPRFYERVRALVKAGARPS